MVKQSDWKTVEDIEKIIDMYHSGFLDSLQVIDRIKKLLKDDHV